MNLFKTTMLLALLTGILVAVGGLIGGTAGMVLFLLLAGAPGFKRVFSFKIIRRGWRPDPMW